MYTIFSVLNYTWLFFSLLSLKRISQCGRLWFECWSWSLFIAKQYLHEQLSNSSTFQGHCGIDGYCKKKTEDDPHYRRPIASLHYHRRPNYMSHHYYDPKPTQVNISENHRDI